MSQKSQAGLKDQTYIAMTSNIFERSIETYRNKIEKLIQAYRALGCFLSVTALVNFPIMSNCFRLKIPRPFTNPARP